MEEIDIGTWLSIREDINSNFDATAERYKSITLLKAASCADGDTAILLGYAEPGDGGAGLFICNGVDDLSAEVAADTQSGIYVQGVGGVWVRQYSGAVQAEWFGLSEGDDGSGNPVALAAAFAASASVVTGAGAFLYSANTEWPTAKEWELSGVRGETTFTAVGGITILSPPDNDSGGHGRISNLRFSSDTGGSGTAIGKAGPDNYLAHVVIEYCDFQKTLQYGIDAQLIACDVSRSYFGFPTGGVGVDFTAIRGVGTFVAPEHSLNVNRILHNEIFNCNGEYAVYFETGYHLVFDGNIFEQNETTTAVVGYKDFEQVYWDRNEVEFNGAVPIVKVIQGTTLSSVINVFDRSLFNIDGADCVIDLTDMTNKRLTFTNNLVAAQTAIVKDGTEFDNLDWFVEYKNNFITGSTSPITPNSSTFDWGYGGSGAIGGGLAVGGSVVATKFQTEYGSVSAPTGVATTVFTPVYTTDVLGTYLLVCSIKNAGTTYVSSTMVVKDPSNVLLVNTANGSALTLSTDGTDVTVLQGSGATQPIWYTLLRLN